MVASRFDVLRIRLDPTGGHELRKTRPCLVVSPDEMNRHLSTLVVAPMTTKGRAYPTRVSVHFGGKDGQVVLDRIRTVDRPRVAKRLGRLDQRHERDVLAILSEMFAP